MAFSIVVRGLAAPQHVETVKAALLKLASESMRQPGTLRYEFYQGQDDPNIFVLLAMWEDEAGWRVHVKSPEHDAYLASLPEDAWLERPALTKMIALGDFA